MAKGVVGWNFLVEAWKQSIHELAAVLDLPGQKFAGIEHQLPAGICIQIGERATPYSHTVRLQAVHGFILTDVSTLRQKQIHRLIIIMIQHEWLTIFLSGVLFEIYNMELRELFL